ncbi:MAG: serine/threonine protein kinase [Chloroflexi bacterium]|uniref:non-specific serine/threonine protein kinase n=1 Tax=Candidatus Chlorohelix allophototropha TaxID=3003348 RepID=A0A8T7MAF3_9CHLR|nr:serine/threonine protein kinase [Chloroflexota bacterium]WJW68949.1 serine/threonine protein kinase [Chloroflexota bacterium L227-S17]
MSGQLEKGYKLGQYEIIEPLGKGGMASVYRAHQPSLERDVAIKIMAEQYATDPSFVERFRREARSIAKLRHPNILTVYDAGEDHGLLYMVMELIEGPTLKDEIQGKPLSLDKTAKVMQQISGALHYANNSGIIHRDVKPSNVLIDKTGRAVLSDFGIAKMAEAKTQLTSTGTGVGTPDYMSPEQAMGEELDARSDEYSLGVMLYEMLTGRPPFTGDTPIAVVMGHVSKPLPSPRQYNPDIPPSVERVISKALSKKAEDRYKDCETFNDALVEAIKNKEREATPPVSTSGVTQVQGYAQPRPGSGSYQTVTNPEAEQLYAEARRLEQQNNFYGSYDAFNRLNSRFPAYRDVNTILQRYQLMGYGTGQNVAWSNQVPSGTGYQSSRSYTPASGQYYGGQTPPPLVPNTSAKSGSSLPIVLGIVGALALVAVVVLGVLVATGGDKKGTPTAQAAVTPTSAPTTAANTTSATTKAVTTTAVTSKAATTTVRPNTTTSAPQNGTVNLAYPGAATLDIPDVLLSDLGDSFSQLQNGKVEAYKTLDDANKVKDYYVNSLSKGGWQDQTDQLNMGSSLTTLESLGAFVLGYQKGTDAVAIMSLPGSLGGALGFTNVGQKDTLILVITGSM